MNVGGGLGDLLFRGVEQTRADPKCGRRLVGNAEIDADDVSPGCIGGSGLEWFAVGVGKLDNESKASALVRFDVNAGINPSITVAVANGVVTGTGWIEEEGLVFEGRRGVEGEGGTGEEQPGCGK